MGDIFKITKLKTRINNRKIKYFVWLTFIPTFDCTVGHSVGLGNMSLYMYCFGLGLDTAGLVNIRGCCRTEG